MSFLTPIALWALAGLMIPIGIHLLSRKEGKTIRMGSIRFLSETATSKFSSIKLNEVVLLIIRCALLITIVLFLAGLLLPTSTTTEKRMWAVVEDGLEHDQRMSTLLDSLSKQNYELKKLEAEFPGLNETHASPTPDYYKLAEQLSETENLQAVVIAKNRFTQFKGNRIALPENITWLAYPTAEINGDTTIRTTKITDTLAIALVWDEVYQYDKKIMRAALNALEGRTPQPIAVTEINTVDFSSASTPDWLIWLSDSIPNFQGHLLYFKENSFNTLLYAEGKNTWALASRLNQATALENHLSIQLMKMLFGNTVHPTTIQQRDVRSISDSLAWSQKAAGLITIQKLHSRVDNVLFIIMIILFLAERKFAFYRKQ
jgi:hypothetical protein